MVGNRLHIRGVIFKWNGINIGVLKGSFSLSVTVDFDLCNDTPGGLDSSVNVFVDYFNVMRKVK